jgi:transcriptional regulator with XRE-family HTH domain
MAPRPPVMPTVGKRQLARELRSAREAASLTLDQVAAEMDWAKTKVHNLENGRWTRSNLTDLRGLLSLYDITDPGRREKLEQLMREAKKPGWWVAYGDALDGALPAFEDEASEISCYEPNFVPGLLQTRDYAVTLLRSYPFLTATEVERKVEARLKRQQILTRESPHPPTTAFVVEEAALQRLIGNPDVLGPQLEHLIAMANSDAARLTLQVLPLRSGLHGAMGGSFAILDFSGDFDLSIVYTESAARNAYLEAKEEIAKHRTMFTHACGKALTPADSITLLNDLIKQHT